MLDLQKIRGSFVTIVTAHRETLPYDFFRPDPTVRNIQTCHRSGLVPEEGVQFCFCMCDSSAAF